MYVQCACVNVYIPFQLCSKRKIHDFMHILFHVEGVSLKAMAAVSAILFLLSPKPPFVIHEATYITCLYRDYIHHKPGTYHPAPTLPPSLRHHHHHIYSLPSTTVACKPLAHSLARFLSFVHRQYDRNQSIKHELMYTYVYNVVYIYICIHV